MISLTITTIDTETSPDNSSNLIDLKRDDHVEIELHDKPNSLTSQKSQVSLPLPSTSSYPLLNKTTSKQSISTSLKNFTSRNIKHHTFDSGFQDVKNMEKNLISLLDDFHNGKYFNLSYPASLSRSMLMIFSTEVQENL